MAQKKIALLVLALSLMLVGMASGKLFPVEALAHSHKRSGVAQKMVVFVGSPGSGKSTIIGQLKKDFLKLKFDWDEIIEIRGKKEYYSDLAPAQIVDILPEEVKANSTIESKFIELHDLGRVIVVDTPGNVKYEKSMLKVIGQVDIAVVVVSAVPEEFETHDYGINNSLQDVVASVTGLGIKSLIFAINKLDHPEVIENAQQTFEDIKFQIEIIVEELNIKDGAFAYVPVSGKLDENISNQYHSFSWYKGDHLATSIRNMPIARDESTKPYHLRMNMNTLTALPASQGTQITGRIISGEVDLNSAPLLCPQEETVRIKSIYTREQQVFSASEGEYITLTLAVKTTDEQIDHDGEHYGQDKLIGIHSYLSGKEHCYTFKSFIGRIKILKGIQETTISKWNATFYFSGFFAKLSIDGICDGDNKCEKVKPVESVEIGQEIDVRISGEFAYPYSEFAGHEANSVFIIREQGRTIAKGYVFVVLGKYSN